MQDDVELEINTNEFRSKATRELTVRQNMAPEEREKIEAVRKSLEPYLKCSHCHQIMLEPWIVKDCGHLFCYNCLDFLVERKESQCPACPRGGIPWVKDPFGWFHVAQLSDNSRRVVRDGAKFIYDDTVDTLCRLCYPERVEEYVIVDTDRERRRIKDMAARMAFEQNVHENRLAQPSATNPNSLATMRTQARHSGSARALDGLMRGTSSTAAALRAATAAASLLRIEETPKQITLCAAELDELRDKVERPSMAVTSPRAPPTGFASFRKPVLVMPIQYSASDTMVGWARARGLIDDDNPLPALQKPYFDADLSSMTLLDLKRLISYQSKLRQFLHDAKATPADISPHELDIYVDWTASTPNTPAWLLEEPLPDASKVATRQPYALRSVFEMLQQSGVNTMPTLDFVYCRRTGSSDL